MERLCLAILTVFCVTFGVSGVHAQMQVEGPPDIATGYVEWPYQRELKCEPSVGKELTINEYIDTIFPPVNKISSRLIITSINGELFSQSLIEVRTPYFSQIGPVVLRHISIVRDSSGLEWLAFDLSKEDDTTQYVKHVLNELGIDYNQYVSRCRGRSAR